jgi:hypothetical protein
MVLLTAIVVGASSEAAAAPEPIPNRQAAKVVSVTPADQGFGALSFTAECFGYTGTFRNGSDVIRVDWATDIDECFGIAPNRTIWHTWPGAGHWVEMPGNGKGDDVGTIFVENLLTGNRIVSVWVNGGSGDWCQNYIGGSGWARSWYNC